MLLVVGVVLAIVAARPFAAAGPQAGLAVAAVSGWLVLAVSTPELLSGERASGALAALTLLAAIALTLVLVDRVGGIGLLALAPAALIAVIPDFADHSRWSLLAAGAAAIAAAGLLKGRPTRR